MEAVRLIGSNDITGAYILWIDVCQDIAVRFGRFQQGKAIKVAAGNYIYVGSAMASKGSMTLARRLLRHTSRSNPYHPHVIREKLLQTIHEKALGPKTIQAPTSKKLHWNVDFLLEQDSVDLSGILIIRSPITLEGQVAAFLTAQELVYPLAPGLGAHDHPGQTHILHVKAGREWWAKIPELIQSSFAKQIASEPYSRS